MGQRRLRTAGENRFRDSMLVVDCVVKNKS